MSTSTTITDYYAYNPNHGAPIAIATIVILSLLVHIWQNIHYRYWKVTYFMVWGGLVYASGWVLRAISTYHVSNFNLYVAQYVLILAGPPIYAAAEYNTLGRLMYYLPMYAPLHPGRLTYFYIYLGAIVEGLTGAGASLSATADGDAQQQQTGSTLLFAALIVQAVIELSFLAMVATFQIRASRDSRLPRNARTVCIMLYGTSTLVLARCIYRAVEQYSVNQFVTNGTCQGACATVLLHEWSFYVFEASPMIIYTLWLNVIHPGRFLPSTHTVFLDSQGVERSGPGWQDGRSRWQTFADPFDWRGRSRGLSRHTRFWERPDEWTVYRSEKELSSA